MRYCGARLSYQHEGCGCGSGLVAFRLTWMEAIKCPHGQQANQGLYVKKPSAGHMRRPAGGTARREDAAIGDLATGSTAPRVATPMPIAAAIGVQIRQLRKRQEVTAAE